MIVHMTHVRVAGPSAMLDAVLRVLQDLGVVHLVRPNVPTLAAPRNAHGRLARHLRRILDDVEAVIQILWKGVAPRNGGVSPGNLPRMAHQVRRLRRHAEALNRQRAALEDERVMLLRYREFFSAFESLVGHELTWPDGQAFYVVLRGGEGHSVDPLRATLEKAVGAEIEVIARPLASGETAVLILASHGAAPRVAQLLAQSRVQELPAPKSLPERNLLRALPSLNARLARIPVELQALSTEMTRLADSARSSLADLVTWLHDQLLVLDARANVHTGSHIFVLEGWLPSREYPELVKRLADELGPDVVADVITQEMWSGDAAPVALENPPIFRPFEVVTRMLPLPRYGSIDPTPFVAVFFPMFFGLMMGDVGYAAVLALVAVLLRVKSKPGTTLRSVASMAAACAAFSAIFGVLFGELFGNLGHFVGLRPLAFNREEAVIPFLALSVALGVVHISLGLVLAMVTSWRRGEKRQAAGRGVATLMVALSVLALLAAFKILPDSLFTPFAIAVLVAFPVLLALEGVVAIIELLSTFGHILSYARIMALGTASVMLAVVANRMVGAMGGALVGVLFALMFHIINFSIGVFSPTIHALRLHYVEFFGKFYSPGCTEYRPLTHWEHVKPQRA